ncbi:hypothetical protein KAI36_02930 [Paenibacillus sp. S02]|nr:hypothetical protein KAI36_02930 [Paenibacillus sp. S02]
MPISRRGKCNDLLVTIPALYDYNIERISLLLSPSSQSQPSNAYLYVHYTATCLYLQFLHVGHPSSLSRIIVEYWSSVRYLVTKRSTSLLPGVSVYFTDQNNERRKRTQLLCNNSGIDGCQSYTKLLQKFTMAHVKPWKEYGGDIPEPIG